MKPLMLSLSLLLLVCAPAFAGRNAGGAMVLHVRDQIDYCFHDYCAEFPLPAACADFDTQIDTDPSSAIVIWVAAAFPANSSPGVNAFQFGIYGDIPGDYYEAFAPCGPGVLEIPDATWPAPGTGTACAYTSTVYDHLFKMYWFATSAPGPGAALSTGDYPNGDHHAEWADDSNPPQIDVCSLFGTVRWGAPGHNDCPPDNPPTGACCFPDCSCQVLTQQDCESQGGVWYGAGTGCDPNPCSCPMGACCLADGSCFDATEADCSGLGETWEGEGTDCATFPCPEPICACCFCDGTCQLHTPTECMAANGIFMGGDSSCDPNPCPIPATGACCIGQGCTITTPECCAMESGEYQGDNSTCSPNPCAPSPTKATTWGGIKAAYR